MFIAAAINTVLEFLEIVFAINREIENMNGIIAKRIKIVIAADLI